MLIETAIALHSLLSSINESVAIKNVCKEVAILTSEKYRENIALDERGKKVEYPIIVTYDESIDYDRSRYYNDAVQSEAYAGVNSKDEPVYYRDVYNPLMPYNLSYRLEIICKQRIQLDTILLWVMQNIPERGILDVKYTDVNKNDAIYESILKRGNFVKADDPTSNMYRRIVELQLTTLIDGGLLKNVIVAEKVNIIEKGD